MNHAFLKKNKFIIKMTSLSAKLFLNSLDGFRILLAHFYAKQVRVWHSLDEIQYYHYCSYDDA